MESVRRGRPALSPTEPGTRASLAARITVVEGYRPGPTFMVEAFPILIGRGEDADVRLEDDPADPTLSRKHLRLSVGGGRLCAQDLSTNGTSLGDRLLHPDELAALDDLVTLRLGPRTVIEIEAIRSGSFAAVVAPAPEPPSVLPTSELEIRTLGRFEVKLEGQILAEKVWDTRRPIILLVYLALLGERSVSVEKLGSELWPDREDARQAVQTGLSRVRRALRSTGNPADPILFERGAYRINPTFQVRCDAADLEMHCGRTGSLPVWQTIRGLYTGDFLQGYNEDWVVARRAYLRRIYLESMAGYGEYLEAGGDHAEALKLYQQLLELESCWESGHQGVLRGLAATGRRQEAVRHYQQYVQTLQRSLGLGPTEEMIRLYHSL